MNATLRFFGMLAIAGGALRVAASFAPWQPDSMLLEGFYFLIDLCLLLGLVGFYLTCGVKTGVAGRIAFLVAFAGLALIAGPDGEFLGADIYQTGVLVIAAGIGLLSVILLLQKQTPKAPALLWLSSIAASVAGALAGQAAAGFMLGGVLFGVGFAAAGLAVFRAA